MAIKDINHLNLLASYLSNMVSELCIKMVS